MYACIILHNLIVEDGHAISKWSDDENEEVEPPNHGPTHDFTKRLQRLKDSCDTEVYHTLQHNLLKHP
ncbi:hypothetical protein HanXRQr2_Chr15g0691551 [Helianthus annuus]|uniref:Uncharacterized protein n=1 Tax=Helianthus annuus TaxID=4232 RepID=A0A9K3H4D6_HELAN|nr:hypothetical protein HanXRQr2_Chr15g0691551 [Helianthus annuus]KAJ0831127.1 hypothetical protein HanPSC8_Chr15g0663431 [Helianthus annuus]